MITGSTDGIGRAMTVQLARKKINVVIVGRSAAKLEEVITELTSKYSVQVKLQTFFSFLFSGARIHLFSSVDSSVFSFLCRKLKW